MMAGPPSAADDHAEVLTTCFPLPGPGKYTPSSSPFTHASSHRRKAKPVDDSSKKNSLRNKPSTEPSIDNLAPPSDTSLIVQLRRHVPSIAMMLTGKPRSNTTRCSFRCSGPLLCNDMVRY